MSTIEKQPAVLADKTTYATATVYWTDKNIPVIAAVQAGVSEITVALLERMERQADDLLGQPTRKVFRPPASWLVAALQVVFTQRSYKAIFAQAIADMREEYFEAWAAGRFWTARLRHAQLYLILIVTVLAMAGANFGKLFARLWKIGG